MHLHHHRFSSGAQLSIRAWVTLWVAIKPRIQPYHCIGLGFLQLCSTATPIYSSLNATHDVHTKDFHAHCDSCQNRNAQPQILAHQHTIPMQHSTAALHHVYLILQAAACCCHPTPLVPWGQPAPSSSIVQLAQVGKSTKQNSKLRCGSSSPISLHRNLSR